MNETEGRVLVGRLLHEDFERNRSKYQYTYDALPHLITYPLSHSDVRKVISGESNYDELPLDADNEIYKGFAFEDQAAIIMANQDKEPLCEALEMKPCKKEACPLYVAVGAKDSDGDTISNAPLCREFKIAFKR